MVLERVPDPRKFVPIFRFVGKSKASKYLKELGIELGEGYKCTVCGDTITEENLGAVISMNGSFKFVCTKKECMNRVHLLSPP
ncbi:MAG TPA: hypothetical protein ENF65_02030 [Euryarchaeota archaeon]|nr:hypothetical protein [Euryarchaeota archaeon]